MHKIITVAYLLNKGHPVASAFSLVYPACNFLRCQGRQWVFVEVLFVERLPKCNKLLAMHSLEQQVLWQPQFEQSVLFGRENASQHLDDGLVSMLLDLR